MQPYIPDPGAPAYRDQVASSIQGLVSGQRPRNQAMSGVGTGRLMLEGVVESLRIYREWKEKEEKKRTEGSGDGERKRRGTGRGGKKDRGHSHRSRRHGEEKRSVEGSEERHGHRRRRRRREARAGRDADREGRECHHQEESQRTQSPQPTLSSALNTEEQLLGPDGTPFGSLPVKGKGVGIAAHARTVYRHVKAEQEAGRRSKGLAEKHLGAFWKKRRSVERDGDEEPLVRKGGRRDQRSSVSRDREGGRRSRRDGGGVYERERDGGQVADASARSAKPGRPPTPFAQGSSLPVRPSRQGSRHCRQDSMDPGDGLEGGESSRSAGQAPTIHVQSPAPPEPTKSVRSATPFTTPTPSNAPPPPPISTAPFMVATPYNLTPSVADVPVPVVPATPSAPLPSRRPRRPPRPPPTPPAPPTGDAARGALMAGFLGGAPNLRKVDPNRKKHSNMFSAGRVIAGSDSEGRPVYEGTPHSDEVEAREHAEAVEERERKEEEIFRKVNHHRTVTPLTAPQPRVAMPRSFQDELTVKLRRMDVSRQGDRGVAGPSLRILRPRPSSESWRTVASNQEEDSKIPDKTFRETLGNSLSVGSTPQPQSATAMPSQARSRTDTPAPDVFVNFAANIAGGGPG